MPRMEIAARYIDKRLEIAFHVVVVFTLFQYQLQRLRDLSAEHSDALPPHYRGVDYTDTQWRDFRRGLPLLTAALLLFVCASQAVRRLCGPAWHTIFYATAGSGFACYLHGAYAAFPVLFAAAFFCLAHAVKNLSYAPAVLWGAVIASMFLIESNRGWYRTDLLAQASAISGPHGAALADWASTLFRRHQGVYRWHVGFNMVALRLLSFGLDLREAASGDPPIMSAPTAAVDTSKAPCYAARQNTPRPLGEYGVISFLAYVFYLPLYIAGPTTTFNAFASHITSPQDAYSTRYKVVYALRWGMLLLLMEYSVHNLYIWGLSKSRAFLHNAAPLDLAIMGFFLLNALWLKFAIIWRHARLVSLLDGVEVPENMMRCMNNNFTIAGFWRNWHKSFNVWLVRYIYIPLGGKRWQLFNVWPIFIFVAMWHDMELNLLKWGLLMACFMIPETLIASYFNTSDSVAWMRVRPWWRYAKASVGTINITVLMTANLIGFGVGASTDTVLARVSSLWWVVLFGFIEFFSATCIMIEVREWEAIQEERHKNQ